MISLKKISLISISILCLQEITPKPSIQDFSKNYLIGYKTPPTIAQLKILLQKFIKDGGDINEKTYNGASLLSEAMVFADYEMAQMLFELKADPKNCVEDLQDSFDRMHHHPDCTSNMIKTVNLVLSKMTPNDRNLGIRQALKCDPFEPCRFIIYPEDSAIAHDLIELPLNNGCPKKIEAILKEFKQLFYYLIDSLSAHDIVRQSNDMDRISALNYLDEIKDGLINLKNHIEKLMKNNIKSPTIHTQLQKVAKGIFELHDYAEKSLTK